MSETTNTKEKSRLGWLDPRDFGALGDGVHRDGAAIQAALDCAGRAGGGLVALSGGAFLSGALVMRSGVELRIERGARLLASEEAADYPLVEARWEGSTRTVHASLVSGRDLRDIALSGGGTIDGQGGVWWRAFREGRLAAPRPRLISFEDCEDLLVEDLLLLDSPSWTLNPVRCRGVVVRGVRIRSPADSPNTDGINPDSCQSVLIEGCRISSGDDCITLKSGSEAEAPELRAPCRDIVIANCILEAGHGGVVVGSEMSGGVSRVVVSNCVFRGTDRGVRIKSRRGRGGLIEDLRLSNLVMEGVACPLAINLRYHCGAKGDPLVADRGPRPLGPGTPRVRGISIEGLTARGATTAAAWIEGLPESPILDLALRDCHFELAQGTGLGPAAMPEMADGLEALAGAGFLARHVRGLRLSGVRVEGQSGPAFGLEACELAGP